MIKPILNQEVRLTQTILDYIQVHSLDVSELIEKEIIFRMTSDNSYRDGEIFDLHSSGVSQSDIAAKFGITQGRVSQILKRG